MARKYDLHVLTLAQVTSPLRVEGAWPGSIGLSAGWFRARARPWNESISDPMIRLDRGGSEFLGAVIRRLFDLGARAAYSPALYGMSTRVWRRSGFTDFAGLEVMELILSGGPNGRIRGVRLKPNPNWDEILDIDRAAFEGFWGMSRLGLTEAHQTNRSTALFVAGNGGRPAGYAIVGVHWGTGYLHRIAVRPPDSGRGLGAALLTASIDWAMGSGSRSMILNVRPENTRAKRLYRRHGFADTGTSLQVLHHQAH